MRKPTLASASASVSRQAVAAAEEAKAKAKGTPCCIKVGLKRGPWTPEEDEVLSSFVHREGEGKWRTLPKRAGLLRCGKSCRLRWMNYLRPNVKRGQIAPDEEDLILRLHRLLGNRWSLIAGRLPGRTDNEIKNYWNTHLSKKLISQGIDPRTHKPLTTTDMPPGSLQKDNTQTPRPPTVNPNPNPNVGSTSTSLLGPNDCTNLNVAIEEEHYPFFDGSVHNNSGGWHSFDGTVPGAFPSSHVAADGVEISDIDCCTDDVFSSFLNSLINDDMFLQQDPQTHANDGICDATHSIDLAASSDPAVSPAPAGFGNQAFWEPAATHSPTFAELDKHNVQSSNHTDN